MKNAKAKDINYMVVEKGAVIKFDKHIASRVFSPDELEALDSYMMKYRKCGIVELLDNKLDGICVSAAPEWAGYLNIAITATVTAGRWEWRRTTNPSQPPCGR